MTEKQENKVWNLFNDLSGKPGITEIIINNPNMVFVERDGRFIQLNVNLSKKDISNFISEVATFNQKECNSDNPILDGNMPDGSRINVIMDPFSHGSPAITIRKYLKNIRYFGDIKNVFGLDSNWIEFLRSLVLSKLNITISGGTGAGKTTMLNMLINEIPEIERVISIEDTLELSYDIPNSVRLEAGGRNLASKANLVIRDLVKNTLRMRPDRIILGEVRGGELFDLLQAMNTGHDGSMTTIHSNSPGECLTRMETLYLLAGFEVPNEVVRRQISSALDFIIQIRRTREGKRIVSKIVEVTGMEGNRILTQDIAEFIENKLVFTGITPMNLPHINEGSGLPLDFFAKMETSKA